MTLTHGGISRLGSSTASTSVLWSGCRPTGPGALQSAADKRFSLLRLPGGDMIYHWVCAQKPEMGRCQEQLNGVTSLRVSADWKEERADSPTAAILILPSSASAISTRPERGSHSPSAREGAGRKKEGLVGQIRKLKPRARDSDPAYLMKRSFFFSVARNARSRAFEKGGMGNGEPERIHEGDNDDDGDDPINASWPPI
ncbi:hypothetical protein BGY98DRAFT_931427 [Russula aff. rugulosa BPL654]|nr:hypothetical protein BGY98DRAFT_931427 [Russula aff. rugulosa BPL654]